MKALITLIFIGAMVFLGFMVSRGDPTAIKINASPPPSNLSGEKSSISSSNPNSGQGGGNPTGKLYVFNQTSKNNEIYVIDVVTKEKKVIYDDSKSEQKIKSVSSLSPLADSIVMVLGSDIDPAGQLVAITIDGSGKKSILTEGFVSTNAPTVSPDQTKLALVSFSNAEPNVGFTLSLVDINGKNRQDLVTDSSGIGQVEFSPDGRKIAFVKGASATNNQIAVVNLDNQKVETLYSLKSKLIEDFDWSPLGPLLISAIEATKKTSQESELYLVDVKNKSELLLTNNGKLERSPVLAPDATGISYIEFKNPNSRTGELVVALTDGKSPTVIGSATQILGWFQ